jgi:two-component system, cell cycle response regulator
MDLHHDRTTPWRVLVADDDPSTRLLLRRALERAGLEVVEAEDGDQAWNLLTRGVSPQLAILDWMMPGVDGLELCRRLRSLPSDNYVYVVLLSARDQKQDLLAGLEAGADDYLAKPFDREQLEARLLVGKRIVAMQAELQQAKQQLWLLATHDSLTGVWNRRGILEILQRELARTDRRPEEPVSVLLADVDHFKSINDSLGHAAGDRVLAELAKLLGRKIRSYDALGRYGGEEFLLVLPRTTTDQAHMVAERLRQATAEANLGFYDTAVQVSVSIGVATSSPEGRDSPADILCRADEGLYLAKRSGRNRVQVATTPDPATGRGVPTAAN